MRISIPTGKIADVGGTAFDFRTGHTVGGSNQRYDHNFALGSERLTSQRRVATLEGAQSRTRLDLLDRAGAAIL